MHCDSGDYIFENVIILDLNQFWGVYCYLLERRPICLLAFAGISSFRALSGIYVIVFIFVWYFSASAARPADADMMQQRPTSQDISNICRCLGTSFQ